MANVSITSSSIFPTSITVEETGKTITLTDNTAVSKNIVVDQLTVTESPSALNDISDVNITSLADDQILVYDSATSKWVNEAQGTAAVTSVNTQTGAVVLDTDDISEGSTNLYYADSLVDSHLVGGTGVTYSAGNISIGQPVGTTDDVTFGEVTGDEFIGLMRGANIFRAQAGEALTKGDAVYISGISGNTPVVSKADADDATKMPAFGIANATVSTSASVDVLTLGQLTNIDTTGPGSETWSEGDTVYVSSTAGVLTNVKPTGETGLIQNMGQVEKVHATTGIIYVVGPGRTNATPNLNDGNIFIGNSSNQATTSSLDTEVGALGYITASSTDTLTNKSGNISQWTNDAGYLTSETDSQTLSFSSPNLTISNGNTVDISAITSSSLENIVEDTTPELGGDLDTKDFVIKNTGTGDIGTVDIEDGVRIIGANLRFSNTAKTFNTTLSATTPTANTSANIPNHTGHFALFGTEPTGAITDGSNGQVLTTDGSGGLSFTTVSSGGLSNVVEDTTPQLGGNLDAQSNEITAVSKLEVTNTSTDDSILITTTEDTSTAAPVLTFKRNSSSPADGDYLGQLKFKGENDADQEVIYAKITAKTSDVTDTSEDGLIEFALRKAGANNIGMRLTSTDLKLLNGTEMDMGSQQIHNVADPTSAQDVATKNYVDSGASGLTSIVQDTTPQLGGNLDVNNFTISNANTSGIVDFDSRATITENVADYSLLIDNQNTQGLGIKIKAGDDAYAGSLAILSVADKDDTLVLTAKADGAVIVYDNLTVDDVFINSPSAGQMQISTLVGDDLNITTNSGTLSLNSINFPGSDGSANQILKTDGAGQLSFVDVSTLALQNVVEDTTPQLGGKLDQNGQTIDDDSRNYQIIGNQASPSSTYYDSFNNTARVHGVVNISEVTGPTNRVHSNPRLSLVTMDADVSGSTNAGRLRQNYIEGVLETDGYDNTTSGFGRGHNGCFLSGKVENNHATDSSTVTESTALVVTPQVDGTQTVTVGTQTGIKVRAYAGSSGTSTNFYGYYYQSPSGTAANVGTSTYYSFYGDDTSASAYNAGGFTPGAFASTSMPTASDYPNGTIVSISDNSYKPAYNASGTWKYVADDSNV